MNLCLQLLYIMRIYPPEIYSWSWPNRLPAGLKSLIKYDTVSAKIAIMTIHLQSDKNMTSTYICLITDELVPAIIIRYEQIPTRNIFMTMA
jgi:hypothetical protein